jgi:hypothetical protein
LEVIQEKQNPTSRTLHCRLRAINKRRIEETLPSKENLRRKNGWQSRRKESSSVSPKPNTKLIQIIILQLAKNLQYFFFFFSSC